MTEGISSELIAPFWAALGVAGGLVFYGRFYVQWLVSERRGQSVMPIGFWYMSGAGSLMLLPYAVVSQSPIGALSQCFNIVVYTRNLVHIWRRKGRLTKRTNTIIHTVAALITIVAISSTFWVWLREYDATRSSSLGAAQQTWIWLGAGLAGQALFAARFALQWAVTEKRGESTVPPAFWYLSLGATILQTACFTQRQEWVFAIGMAATVFVYIRNIMLLRVQKPEEGQE